MQPNLTALRVPQATEHVPWDMHCAQTEMVSARAQVTVPWSSKSFKHMISKHDKSKIIILQ